MKVVSRIFISALLAGVAVFVTSGCDKIGQTPSGGSDAEVKAAFDKMPLEDRVKAIMASPAPRAVKEQKVKDMYAKEGKTPPADLVGPTPGSRQQ